MRLGAKAITLLARQRGARAAGPAWVGQAGRAPEAWMAEVQKQASALVWNWRVTAGEEIGIGTHERIVIDLAKFSARLKKPG